MSIRRRHYFVQACVPADKRTVVVSDENGCAHTPYPGGPVCRCSWGAPIHIQPRTAPTRPRRVA